MPNTPNHENNKTITAFTETQEWDLPQTEIRQKLIDLELACKTCDLPEADIPATEFFSDGCYGRQVFIPKGTCLVGEIHRTEWIIVVSRGKIKVVSEEGISIIDATEAPVTFISPAGVKRAGYALEDTWWTGFRATPLTSTEAIRKEHLVDSYTQLEDKHNVGSSRSNGGS